MASFLWTHHKARLRLVSTKGEESYNWLFLPGGPGLGSDSLSLLTKDINLPGSIWHLDLPGDGSNRYAEPHLIQNWQPALLEAVKSLPRVILVAHSTGGMFALSTAGLEPHLKGLVLISAAPDTSWQDYFMAYVANHPLKTLESVQHDYAQSPTDELFKRLTIASAPYFMTQDNLIEKVKFFEDIPFNHHAYDWCALHFDPFYECEWIPHTLPTLIMGGEDDKVTPIRLFTLNKDFMRRNIVMKVIRGAAHFPWIDNPPATVAALQDYVDFIKNGWG